MMIEAREKDASGREIAVRKLDALDRMQLFEIVGADNTRNEAYFGYATLAFSVTHIAGEEVSRPRNKLTLEARVKQLGDDGLNAAATAMKTLYPKIDEEEEKDAIKN